MKTGTRLFSETGHVKNLSVIPQEKSVKDNSGQNKTSGSVTDSPVPANTVASGPLRLRSTCRVIEFFFFSCGPLVKVFIEFDTILLLFYVLVFWLVSNIRKLLGRQIS